MPGRFYPVAVEVDGRTYTGEWALLLSGEICVRSLRWGKRPPQPLGKARPEVAAKRILEQIVKDWRRKQARDARQIERETLRVARTGRVSRPKRKS